MAILFQPLIVTIGKINFTSSSSKIYQTSAETATSLGDPRSLHRKGRLRDRALFEDQMSGRRLWAFLDELQHGVPMKKLN